MITKCYLEAASMRGKDVQQQAMFSYLSPEARVPRDHPLRPIRDMVNQALAELSGEFQAMYSREGRPSIPPEKLLRALLLQILYTIRSARLLMEQLDYNLLLRWFVGLSMDDKVWDHSVFSKNQERFLDSDLAAAFFARILKQAASAGLLSGGHFTVDGTLIEAWASLKSFRPKDAPPPEGGGRNPAVDFHGEKRLNQTHASTTDPEARLFKKGKGKEAKLCFMGPCAHGEPPRPGGLTPPHRGHRHRRTGGGGGPGGGRSRPPSHYPGRRQGLRYPGICPLSAGPESRAPCGPKL